MRAEPSLADHERAVRADLAPQSTTSEPATAVLRASVRRWALLQLSDVCPLTTMLLRHDGRLDDEVDALLAVGHRPTSIHRWGQDLLVRLLDDRDPFIADLAHMELALVAPRRADELRPGAWRTSFDPESTVVDLLAGRDPRARATRESWFVVEHDERGWRVAMC